MGKQSGKPTPISQAQFDKDLDSSLEILHKDGASDQELIDYTNDFKSRFTVVKPTSQKKNPVQSGASSSGDGSSDSQSIDPKTGFPKIDSNGILPNFEEIKSVAKNNPVKNKNKNRIVNYQKPKEDSDFLNYLKENLDAGISTVSKSIYDTPGYIYDAAALVTNSIAGAFGVDEKYYASSDKLAKDLGFRNIPSEILKESIKKSNEKINAYASKNGGDALKALEEGKYSSAAKLIAGSTVQSLPIMVAAMASGGESMAMGAIGLSTASTKNAELKDEHPQMKLGTRILNSANAGVIEAVTGHLFTGASGAVMKRILAEKGAEVGSKIISKSFKQTLENAIEKNPLVGALGEVVEETAVEFGNQANDIASGIRTEFDIHAIKNAGLSATGMGGIQTVGVYGAKSYIKAKDYNKIKSVNKEIFKLRTELENGNLSEDNKNILVTRIDRLLLDNKKLLGSELEKLKALPTETKKELNTLNLEFENISQKFENIKDDNDLSTDAKQAMIDELKTRTEVIGKRKNEILKLTNEVIVDKDFSNFNGVEPDFNIEAEAEKVENEVVDIEKKIKELEDIRDNGQPLKPLMFEEDYSQEELDIAEEKHQRKVKEHISDLNKQIEQKKSELESKKNAPQEKSDSDILDESYQEEVVETAPSEPEAETESVETAQVEPIGELTNDEFLEAIDNDNVSEERLTDIATKLSNNEKLSNREQKIAEKNKEVINQKTTATKAKKVAELSELTSDEYLDFIDNDKVSPDRLFNIAYKNENELPLTKRESDIYNSQKPKVDKLQKNNRSWLKDETLNQDVEAEFDNLLSGEAEQRRKTGTYTKDGVTYTRQEEQAQTPTGSKGTVKFADNVEQEFEYVLQEEETLQPAHLNSKRNPLHFVPEMQPKNRKDQSSQVASDKISDNPKLDEAGENSNAYSGAPVVNARGEVIQGNNRSEGLKKHYQRGGTKYKQQLIDNAAKFGFTPEQVQGMNKPVLVRRLKVDDAKAIELGNYDAKDIETGGARKIDPVTTSRRIPQQDKSKMTESIFENTDTETTLTEAIKQNFKPFFDKVRKHLNPAQVETILGKTGTPSADGVQDLVKLVQQFIFDGANTDLAEQFERLSHNAKQGLLKALPNILSVSKDKSLLTEVQNAVVAVSDFTTSKIENFKEWTNQTSMFEEQQTPNQKYTELELNIAELLINAKKQSDVSNVFKEYTNLVSDSEMDFFNPDGIKGISKQEAVKQVFKTNNNQDGNKQQEQPTNTGEPADIKQDGAIDPEGESKPRQQVELLPESPTVEQGAGNQREREIIFEAPSLELQVPPNPFDAQLLKLGYNQTEISKMTMEQKQDIAIKKTQAPIVENSSKVDIAKENAKQEKIAEAQKKLDEEIEAEKDLLDVLDEEKQEEAETPTPEPKQSKRKVRDENIDAELDDAFKDLRDELGKLMSGINPELAIKGAKIIAIYTKAGVYKFSDIIEDAYVKFGEISKELFDAIKQGYASYYATVEDSIADQMDSNVRIFTFESIIDKLNKDEQTEQPTESEQPSPTAALQPNSKRPLEAAPQELLPKPSSEQGIGSRSQPKSNPVPRATRNVGQSSNGQGDLFSGNAPVLEEKPKNKVEVQIEKINQVEKQEPALVDFSLQDNEQDKFNATKKYTDNINALQTLLTIIKEKRKATPEEKTAVAKYVGFGGLKEIAFNPDNNEAWKESTVKYKDQVRKVIELTQELDTALGINNSLAEIRAGILTAHYTPKTIIDTMFNVLEKLGFKNGNILEPSAGIGNFIGYMPSKMRSNSNITAVELDNLTGNILKYLYDDANTQITGIQNALVANNSQDVVISNVPFGNFKIFDKEFKGQREFLTKRIHNYFFAKALDKVREGGIVMFVTSKGVLDSKGNQNVREYLNQNADFLGAVRLPSTVFQNNANTSVVTDIIILRKNTTGEKKNPNFIDVVDLEVTDKNGETKTITINKFFAENRNVLLGEIVPGGMYSEKDYSLADPDNKMGQIWERVSEMLDQHKGTFQPTTGLNAINRTETDQDLLNNTKNGNIAISNEGKIVKRVGSEFQEVAMPSYVKGASVKKYIDIRNALFDLILMEYSGESDVLIEKLRQRLNFAYTTKRTISAKEFDRIATEDGDGFNVLALEDNNGKKADIFTKRTINPLKQVQNTDNVEEAIIISLYENAKIDMDRISELMNKPVSEVMEIAKGKIFESPTGGFFTREEYLSGNVKKKLAEAKKAVESGYAEFEFNKTELEAVIPKDIPAVSIEVRLGSRWVPVDIINDFADHLFKGENVVINYAKSTDTYNNNGKAHSVNATEKWGTKRKNGADLLVDALHAATPAIYDTTEDGKRILNKEETEKAVQKFEEIRAEFENWVYTNAERRERLGAIYNEKYNTTVRRKYDGSHLNIPGINGVNLYPHQKDAIWMLLQNNGGIIDHIVGAGKTFVMVAGTAEMKRTGVSKKPMILALKSTIPQIVETYKQSYPLAKILAPSEKDFQSKNRQKLFSQISLNDWDVIIMSHENFNAIPHRIEYLTKQIDDEIAEIEVERVELFGDKRAMAGLETRIKNLQARLEKLTDIAKDNSVKFQEMGIDHVMVDESQQFKNLAYMTKQRNVAGLSKAEGSRRAFNLLVGMRYLQEVFGADKGTTFLSGTPISNSMVEMYSLLKYMRPNKMKELGFNTFDQWATTFASPTNEIEYTVTGQFKSKTRFREFINVPELSLLYNEIADVRNDDNLTLDKPKMKGGGYTTMFIPMNEEQADYGQRIIQFAKTKDGSVLGLKLSENQKTAYMLLATNLSSKMAIDMRLINKDYAYDPNGKVGKMTDEAVKVYNETNEHKGVQLIFSDLGTPKNKNNQSEMLKDYMEDELGVPQDTLVEIFGNFAKEGHRYQPFYSIKQKAIDVLEIEETDFNDYVEQAKESGETFNLYDEIKKRLIEKGIPENEIVFIHSYNNQKAKEKLFEKVNAGEVRVILGSTQKLGTGVNVQKRLAAIHHLDVPWRPSDMEQRNGRGVRQGNSIAKTHLNNEIAVYAYATERTLDGYKYQLLQTKQRFLDQVKSGNIEDRVIKENSEEGSDAYAIFVAELSGNKNILLKFKLEQEKERLTKQRRNFEGSLYEAQGNVRKLESNIPAIEENASKTKQDIESITNKAEYDVTKDAETGIESKKLKINNINGEVLQPEKDSKESKKNKPVERTEYGKKAIELIAQTVKTIKLDQYTKSFEINGLPILVKVSNKKEVSNGKEYVIQKTELAILSPTGQTYTVNNSAIAGVLLNNIQKAIENIPIALEMQEKLINKNKKDLEGYKELAKNDKFPKEEELAKVAAELKEVDKTIQDFEKDVTEDLEQEDNIVNEPNADYGNNRTLALNKTQDVKKFLSLSEPGTEYSNSSQLDLFGQGDTASNNNNKRSVRAVWTKYKNLQFKGTTKVKNAEDVAQIMSLLENKSVEHAFAIHIDQDGNSHIQFLSIGGTTGTVVDPKLVASGVSKFNSKKVYLVHNHPSGNMRPSNGDLRVTKDLREGLNPLGVEVEHVIMDTYLKEYVHIDSNNKFTVNTRGENTFTKKLTTTALTEQEILSTPFGKVTDPNVAFSIIQNFRFSAMPKNAMLVLSQKNEVIGNYVFSNGDITYAEILKFVGETAIGVRIVFYGNQANNLTDVRDFQKNLKKLNIEVLDKIVTSSDNERVRGYYESMVAQGLLNEHLEKYGTGSEKFLELNEPSSDKKVEETMPFSIAKKIQEEMRPLREEGKTDKEIQAYFRNFINNSNWYKKLKPLEQEIVNQTNLRILFDNALKNDINEEVTPKRDFEKKQGIKSVVARIDQGGNENFELDQAIEILGLNYKVENQEIAQNNVKEFVKQVGIEKALKSLKSNSIKGASRAFVYAEVLDQLQDLASNADINNISNFESRYQDILQEALDEFDNEARESGRFISALNRIYNNSKIRYNLTKQINDFKAINNGVISEETLTKFKEADEKIKEIEAKLKEAEEKLLKQEDELVIKNIEEALLREFKDKFNKSYEKKGKEFGAKIRGFKIKRTSNTNVSIGLDLVWDGAIEIVALSLEKTGRLADSIVEGIKYIRESEAYKKLTKEDQQAEEDDFKKQLIDHYKSLNSKETEQVSISEDGLIKIPDSLIKELVAGGLTDIDAIAQRIKLEYFWDNQDVSIRMIRDAITKYGKTVNMSKDEIDIEVRKIKRVGRLISALEDLEQGERPKRSGLQRDKPTQTEREMMREVKELMRDLPMDETELADKWKNALETYKQRLNNRIEDLNKQIDNGEKDKLKREPIELDQEAKDLKQQAKELKKVLDELVGVTQLTEEQKIKRAESFLRKQIENLEQDIVSGNIDYKRKPDPITSDKIQELKRTKKLLNDELNQLRQDKGLVEKRQLETYKQRLKRERIKYQERLNDKDFAKREPKPLPADNEIAMLFAEKEKWQDVFNKAKYEHELLNRTTEQKIKDGAVGVINLPRILRAGGEMSVVFIQGGILTVNYLVRNPLVLAKAFSKAFLSISSNEKYNEYLLGHKADPDYALMKKLKLALTQADYKIETQEEAFIGFNIVNDAWKLAGKGIEIASGKVFGVKETRTIGNKIMSLIKKDIQEKKLPISEQFKNLNPLQAFERGNSIYLNELRMDKFKQAKRKLALEGKNEVDNAKDFETAVKYINVFTGRGKLPVGAERAGDILSTIFFSAKMTYSVFQQLNPSFYLFVLRNKTEGEVFKPSTAQKMALTDMMTFVSVTASSMFLLQAAAGLGDDDEEEIKIETDPRHTDFMQMRIKGKDKNEIRFDPWHGMRPQVVFLARLLSGYKINGKGELIHINTSKNESHWDNFMDTYLINKLSPAMQMIYFQMEAKEDEDGVKRLYGQSFFERNKFYPMYIEAIQEVAKEDPGLIAGTLTALGSLGLANSTYTASEKSVLTIDQQKEGFKVKAKEEATRQLWKDKAEAIFEDKITDEVILKQRYAKIKADLVLQYKDDPNLESYKTSFKNEFKKQYQAENIDAVMQKIKKEKSPGSRAYMIKSYYGDINSPENADIKQQLKDNKVINEATLRYIEKKGNSKKVNSDDDEQDED